MRRNGGTESDKQLRKHLIELLRGGSAYDKFDDIVRAFSAQERGIIPKGAEHSAWLILDHLVRAFEDINDFSDNADGSYKEKNWPKDYWAKKPLVDWSKSIKDYKRELKRMETMVKDPKRDLYEPFPWGSGQTLLREALLAADHQSHHLGQLIELKRWIDADKK